MTTRNVHEELTLRMLGENITLTRNQWEELKAMLAPQSQFDADDARSLAGRIEARLAFDEEGDR